jgi:protein O-GlcNAc transferase
VNPTDQPLQELAHWRRVARLEPESVPAQLALAALLCRLGAREHALGHARSARSLAPNDPTTGYTEALVLIELLRLDQAVDVLREVLDQAPQHRQALSTLLYLLNLLPDLDPVAVAAEHRQRARRCYPEAIPVPRRAAPRRSPGQPIRIGFLSADLRAHPVGRFVQPLFDHLNPERYAIHVYSTSAPDSFSQQLQTRAASWFDADDASDTTLAERIRGDGLDLLVDLSGHTLGQRLGMLALRPAPLQVSWLGYPNTSGLDALDCRLLDSWLAAPGVCVDGPERIVCLDGPFACFRPPPNPPAPVARCSGAVVYGALHRLEKLNERVIHAWSEVLLRTPGARLLIARDQLDGPRQVWLRQRFATHGIDAERLELRALHDADHWPIYQEIDILLDCFPWSGHTLACEALWMGVPVVTLAGASVAGRLTASALQSAGRSEWIAEDLAQYVGIAHHLALQSASLRNERAQLRERTAHSLLCDERRFARVFGEVVDALVAQG